MAKKPPVPGWFLLYWYGLLGTSVYTFFKMPSWGWMVLLGWGLLIASILRPLLSRKSLKELHQERTQQDNDNYDYDIEAHEKRRAAREAVFNRTALIAAAEESRKREEAAYRDKQGVQAFGNPTGEKKGA